MSQTTPHRPRHARREEPVTPPSGTAAIPFVPAQRVAGPLFEPGGTPAPGTRHRYPAEPAPAGLHQAVEAPVRRRGRVLPKVLAVVTAALLTAGLAVALGGAAQTDLTTPPTPVVAP